MRPSDANTIRSGAVVLSTFLMVSIVGAVAFGPVAAEHPEDAPDYTEEANFTIAEVSQSDHYPGEEEASMRYWAAGEDAFHEQGASDGVYIDYIIIDADWIDYSDCDVDNTAAFGIDRGNDNEGTNYDEDLVQKQKEADFRDDGITVEFYDFEDLGGDPPYMAPEDAIVAEQGENSAGGGCLTMTDEPGWYRLQGYANGTVADNGEGEEPSEDADQMEVKMESTWFYVCECESEEEAREELGDPPGETSDDDGESAEETDEGEEGDEEAPEGEEESEETPEEESEGEESAEETPEEGDEEAEEEASEEGDEATPEEGEGESEEEAPEEEPEEEEEPAEETPAEEEPEEEEEPAEEEPEQEPEEPAEEEPEQEPEGEEPVEGDETTPDAEEDGPGFGAVAALVALLASALLVVRRR